MSKQSVSKRGKVVQFPGTQPFMYKGQKVCLSIGIFSHAKGTKSVEFDEGRNCYWIAITGNNLEHAMTAARQYADELGVCL